MSLTGMPPGTMEPTDVVSCKIFVGSTEVKGTVGIPRVSVFKSFNKISYAKFEILDGSVSDRDFKHTSTLQFQPGKEVKIQFGYHGNVETVFEGIIIKNAIKIRKGYSSLMIEAKDKAIKLTSARNNAYFNGKSDKQIIESMAKDFSPDVEETTLIHKQMLQFESTNWDFILTRAEANGMLVLADDGKLIVKKPVLGKVVSKALYGDNIFEFEAEMDARRHFTGVMGHSWDYTKQTTENSKAGKATLTEVGKVSADDLGKILGANVNLNHAGHLTEDQLQSWADAYAMKHKLAKAVGRVKIKGQANLKPGATITIDGVGQQFTGEVFVTGILHQYDGTWKTDVQFGWNEEWFYKKTDVMEHPASGLLPGINGLQIGRVIKVDDVEEKQYRVKVHIPSFSKEDGIWARVATLDAGPDRGVYFRPQEKDEVVLGFLNDDPREAIILGYLHSHDKMKSPLPAKKNTLEYGFVTKEKVKLIFDDTNKRMTLSVKTAKGEKTIILNNTSGTIELKDEHKNIIKMNASGITIDAGPGNVIIKGANVLINS